MFNTSDFSELQAMAPFGDRTPLLLVLFFWMLAIGAVASICGCQVPDGTTSSGDSGGSGDSAAPGDSAADAGDGTTPSCELSGNVHYLTEAMGEGVIQPSSFSPAAVPGDTIIIAADRVSHIDLYHWDGTPEQPYTFTNPLDAKVTINASTSSRLIQIRNSDNFAVVGNTCAGETYGIELDGSNVSPGSVGAIRLWRCSDYEIANIHMHHTNSGITHNSDAGWGGETDWTEANSLGDAKIHHNLIEDLSSPSSDFVEGMYLGHSTPGDYPRWETLSIYNNIVRRTEADCIQAGQTSVGLKIYDNHVEDCGINEVDRQDHGIIVSSEATAPEVFNNTIVRARQTGIYVSGDAAGPIQIHDNVVWQPCIGDFVTWPGSCRGIACASSSNPNEILNNTIVASGDWAISAGSNAVARYNLMAGNQGGGIQGISLIESDNRTSSSIADEYFADPGSGDFSLTSSSPARDAGTGGGYSPTDKEGISRPQGAAADIGAYEYLNP